LPPTGCIRPLLDKSWSNQYGVSEAHEYVFAGPGASLACLDELLERFGSNGKQMQVLDVNPYSFKCGSDTFHFEGLSGAWADDFELKLNGEVIMNTVNSNRCTLPYEQQISLASRAFAVMGGECNEPDGMKVVDTANNPVNFNPWISAEADDLIYSEMTAGLAAGFIDEECKPASANSAPLCNEPIFVGRRGTPLSLIWDSEQARLHRSANEMTLVRFPVDPTKAGALFSWRGSEASPLVVYDPEHLGQITTAAQLIGSYSFGKNWSDGYQALSSLDTNQDGKVAGEELAPLGLWFDRNRNGVSEQGEVSDIRAAGVRALFSKADRNRDGELSATIGFELEHNGKILTGESVDWLSGAVSSVSNALLNAPAAAPSVIEAKQTFRSGDLKGFEGTWLWSEANAGKQDVSGALVLRAQNGKIVGISIVNVPLAPNDKRLVSYISTARIVGGLDSADPKTVLLTTRDKKGRVTESRVTLTRHGDLQGTSTTPLDGNSGEILRYDWKAKRFRG